MFFNAIKMELDHFYFHSLINLDTLSRLPPNTDITLTNGYITPVAGKMSSIVGAQTVYNTIHRYDVAQCVSELDTYLTNINKIVEQLYFNHLNYKITLLSQYFDLAYTNGLSHLLSMYENHYIYQNLYECIYQTKELIDNYTKLIPIDDCPTASFDNQDWQLYINMSHQLQYESIGLYKYYVKYACNLSYNQLVANLGYSRWYDLIYKVDQSRLYLGAMPIKSFRKNDLDSIKQLNIHCVLSVVEMFESQSQGYITKPVIASEWQEHDIICLQLPIPDFETVPMSKIHIGVEYIHWCVQQKKSVYCHCRIGKNRSNLMLMCYLIKYQNFTSERVFDYVQSKRPQVKNHTTTI